MNTLTLLTGLVLGLALGAVLGVLWVRARPSLAPEHESRISQALDQRAADRAVVQEGLARLHDQLRDLEHHGVAWQGQLAQQVLDMRHTTDSLRRETQSLSTALRRPQVRGRWGEMHLRRAVELAGMVDHCDFEEQLQLDDGAKRPDLVIRLAGGKAVVVDAKVPLDAFLDAGAAGDDQARAAGLRRHAGQLRHHVDSLSAKRYWRELPETPEFVVMFMPAESFLSAALEVEPGLLEYAAGKQVVLATPTTLIALLRTVAHGWSHEALAEQAREIHQLGRELHGRLGTMSSHLDQVGRSLNSAVGHYNQAVGSWESRVLVSARRFNDLSVTDEQIDAPRQVEVAGRAVAPLTLHAADRRAVDHEPEPDHTVAL
jgi:DNA recombination protein RmuC